MSHRRHNNQPSVSRSGISRESVGGLELSMMSDDVDESECKDVCVEEDIKEPVATSSSSRNSTLRSFSASRLSVSIGCDSEIAVLKSVSAQCALAKSRFDDQYEEYRDADHCGDYNANPKQSSICGEPEDVDAILMKEPINCVPFSHALRSLSTHFGVKQLQVNTYGITGTVLVDYEGIDLVQFCQFWNGSGTDEFVSELGYVSMHLVMWCFQQCKTADEANAEMYRELASSVVNCFYVFEQLSTNSLNISKVPDPLAVNGLLSCCIRTQSSHRSFNVVSCLDKLLSCFRSSKSADSGPVVVSFASWNQFIRPIGLSRFELQELEGALWTFRSGDSIVDLDNHPFHVFLCRWLGLTWRSLNPVSSLRNQSNGKMPARFVGGIDMAPGVRDLAGIWKLVRTYSINGEAEADSQDLDTSLQAIKFVWCYFAVMSAGSLYVVYMSFSRTIAFIQRHRMGSDASGSHGHSRCMVMAGLVFLSVLLVGCAIASYFMFIWPQWILFMKYVDGFDFDGVTTSNSCVLIPFLMWHLMAIVASWTYVRASNKFVPITLLHNTPVDVQHSAGDPFALQRIRNLYQLHLELTMTSKKVDYLEKHKVLISNRQEASLVGNRTFRRAQTRWTLEWRHKKLRQCGRGCSVICYIGGFPVLLVVLVFLTMILNLLLVSTEKVQPPLYPGTCKHRLPSERYSCKDSCAYETFVLFDDASLGTAGDEQCRHNIFWPPMQSGYPVLDNFIDSVGLNFRRKNSDVAYIGTRSIEDTGGLRRISLRSCMAQCCQQNRCSSLLSFLGTKKGQHLHPHWFDGAVANAEGEVVIDITEKVAHSRFVLYQPKFHGLLYNGTRFNVSYHTVSTGVETAIYRSTAHPGIAYFDCHICSVPGDVEKMLGVSNTGFMLLNAAILLGSLIFIAAVRVVPCSIFLQLSGAHDGSYNDDGTRLPMYLSLTKKKNVVAWLKYRKFLRMHQAINVIYLEGAATYFVIVIVAATVTLVYYGLILKQRPFDFYAGAVCIVAFGIPTLSLIAILGASNREWDLLSGVIEQAKSAISLSPADLPLPNAEINDDAPSSQNPLKVPFNEIFPDIGRANNTSLHSRKLSRSDNSTQRNVRSNNADGIYVLLCDGTNESTDADVTVEALDVVLERLAQSNDGYSLFGITVNATFMRSFAGIVLSGLLSIMLPLLGLSD